jgi:hypothetical protein
MFLPRRIAILCSIVIFGVCTVGCDTIHDPGSESAGFGYTKLESNFASIYTNIINPMCVRCHSGSDAPHGIVLTSYEHILSSPVFPPLVVPGDPDRSSLYKSVVSGKMPKDMRRLSAFELEMLYTWIAKGAGKEKTPEEPPDDGEPPDDDGEPPDSSQPSSVF